MCHVQNVSFTSLTTGRKRPELCFEWSKSSLAMTHHRNNQRYKVTYLSRRSLGIGIVYCLFYSVLLNKQKIHFLIQCVLAKLSKKIVGKIPRWKRKISATLNQITMALIVTSCTYVREQTYLENRFSRLNYTFFKRIQLELLYFSIYLKYWNMILDWYKSPNLIRFTYRWLPTSQDGK